MSHDRKCKKSCGLISDKTSMYLTKFNKWSKICQVKLSGWTNADSEGKKEIIENKILRKTSVIIWLSYLKLKTQMDHRPNSGD